MWNDNLLPPSAGLDKMNRNNHKKQYFLASICREGVLGGGISADDTGITFVTGKDSASPKIRKLEMKYTDIRAFHLKWVLCFPVFSISLRDENYKFIVFSPRRFCALLQDRVNRN